MEPGGTRGGRHSLPQQPLLLQIQFETWTFTPCSLFFCSCCCVLKASGSLMGKEVGEPSSCWSPKSTVTCTNTKDISLWWNAITLTNIHRDKSSLNPWIAFWLPAPDSLKPDQTLRAADWPWPMPVCSTSSGPILCKMINGAFLPPIRVSCLNKFLKVMMYSTFFVPKSRF